MLPMKHPSAGQTDDIIIRSVIMMMDPPHSTIELSTGLREVAKCPEKAQTWAILDHLRHRYSNMVLTSSRLLCHILVAVVVTKEHRGEDLGPENPEAADHHGEDENGLAVAEQAALEVGGVILIIRVVWLQQFSDKTFNILSVK